MRDLDVMLADWQQAGLITPKVADKIRAREATAAATAAPPPSRLSTLFEVLGYLGAALAVIAISVILGAQWGDLGFGPRLGIIGGMTAIVGAAGFALWRASGRAAQRLASGLLLAMTAGAGWLAGVISDEGIGASQTAVMIAVGSTLVAVATPLYLARRRPLPQITALVTLFILIAALIGGEGFGARFEWVALAWAVVALAWFGLGMRRSLAPPAVATVVGAGATIFAIQVGSSDRWRFGMLIAGVVVAAGMVALAVARRGATTVLAPAAVGLLLFIPQLIAEIFADALATWVAVLVTGLVLVVGAVLIVRDRKRDDAEAAADQAKVAASRARAAASRSARRVKSQ